MTAATATPTPLDCRWSVNEVIARHPATIAVFIEHGIDTCCGGGASVEVAAAKAAVDPQRLCAELGAAARVAG